MQRLAGYRAGLGRNPIDPADDFRRLEGLMFAFAQVLLDIDDEERFLHGESVSAVPATQGTPSSYK